METDRIVSNKDKSYSAVFETERNDIILKRPRKGAEDSPTEEEFRCFMEMCRPLEHEHILHYNGVYFLESLEMRRLSMSLRQHLEGKNVIREQQKSGVVKRKADKERGCGSMQPKDVRNVALLVAKGLKYLHGRDVSHDGISTSNILLGKAGTAIKEVRLVDYQLELLGIKSQSHVSSKAAYLPPTNSVSTDKRQCADLYSFGVVMVYMYLGEPKKNKTAAEDLEKKIEKFKKDKEMQKVWHDVVDKCLDIEHYASLTATDIVSKLECHHSCQY